MLVGYILLVLLCSIFGGWGASIVGLELVYRFRRRRRQRRLHDFQRDGIAELRKRELNGIHLLDSRERRRLIERELDKLRR